MSVFRSIFVASSMLCAVPVSAWAEPKAEVIHWYTSASESRAVKAFADAFAAAGGTWKDTAVAGGSNARSVAFNRILGGNPPTAAQFSAGKQADAMIDQDLLRDIGPLVSENGYEKVLPEIFIKAGSRDGKLYTLPTAMQVLNNFFYSPEVLKKSGVDIATLDSWPKFIEALEKIKSAGFIGLAHGNTPPYLGVLFAQTLLSYGGPELYTRVLGDDYATALASPEFKEFANTFLSLRQYMDAGAENRSWSLSTQLVIKKQAGFQIMGDYAKGEIKAAGLEPGTDVGCFMGPGSQSYIIIGDIFVFPKVTDQDQIDGQALLVKTLLAPETQLKFAEAKGSLPLVANPDPSKLDKCAQKNFSQLIKPENQVPYADILLGPDRMGAFLDALVETWADKNADGEMLAERLNEAFELAQ